MSYRIRILNINERDDFVVQSIAVVARRAQTDPRSGCVIFWIKVSQTVSR